MEKIELEKGGEVRVKEGTKTEIKKTEIKKVEEKREEKIIVKKDEGKKKEEKNIFLFVSHVPLTVADELKIYEEKVGKRFRVALLKDARIPAEKNKKYNADIVLVCDFSKPDEVKSVLGPYKESILAVTSRSEKNMSRFIEILPVFLEIGLKVPTAESLLATTDKYEMRKKFKAFDPEMTPKFTRVKNFTEEERERLVKTIGFPMILKPTNLAGSLFVTISYHKEDLKKNLETMQKNLQKAYENDDRTESLGVIAEEYMEGDLYSMDSYVDDKGQITHCPLVRQITATKIGRNDFYNYLQITPTPLKIATIARAERVAENAIMALGLRNVTAHTELMKIDDEWKVVEIGGRAGGFRPKLHLLSCDIMHDINDLLVRMGKKTMVSKKCKGHACALKWFAEKEGKIISMKGVKKIAQLESFHGIEMNKKIGDESVFSRKGGRSVFNLYLYNSDYSKLLADISRVESLVDIQVDKKVSSKDK